ncbi:MAG TPA: hypothetical protein VI942_08845 [Thermoanaerobaculia bacterium]|nr:hypothetical protein [Thermoanaerobaculia bacterium]
MTTQAAVASDIRELESLEFRLAQLRDELRNKTYLARPGRDPWDRLEGKWQRFRSRVAALREAGDARPDVRENLRGLAHELGEGYEKLRNARPPAKSLDF